MSFPKDPATFLVKRGQLHFKDISKDVCKKAAELILNDDTASDSSDADSDTDSDTDFDADSDTDLDTDSGSREPKNHRPEAISCQNVYSPAQPPEGTSGNCSQHADCTEGNNGKCVPGMGRAGGTFFCVYDLCITDD